MSLKTRVARLQNLCPAPPAPDPDEKLRVERYLKIYKRFVRLVDEAEILMTAEERQRLSEAIPKLLEAHSPLALWESDLMQGHCRLPPEISAPVVKDLLLAWASPDCDDQHRFVCLRCGMEYPHRKTPPSSQWKLLPGKVHGQGEPPWYDLPVFFRICPNCGASSYVPNVNWAHLIDQESYPWMKMDGCVGLSGR